jgi:hypothetical protein
MLPDEARYSAESFVLPVKPLETQRRALSSLDFSDIFSSQGHGFSRAELNRMI